MLTELGILEGADKNTYPETGSLFPSNRVGSPFQASMRHNCIVLFFMWTIFKVFTKFVTVLLLFCVLVFLALEACGILALWPGIEPSFLTSGVQSFQPLDHQQRLHNCIALKINFASGFPHFFQLFPLLSYAFIPSGASLIIGKASGVSSLFQHAIEFLCYPSHSFCLVEC